MDKGCQWNLLIFLVAMYNSNSHFCDFSNKTLFGSLCMKGLNSEQCVYEIGHENLKIAQTIILVTQISRSCLGIPHGHNQYMTFVSQISTQV
jgi:hypothetical protein